MLVGAEPDARLGEVERVARRRARPRQGDAVAARGSHAQLGAEAAKQPVGLEAGCDDHAVGALVPGRRRQPPLAVPTLEPDEAAALDDSRARSAKGVREAGHEVLRPDVPVHARVQARRDSPPIDRGLERRELVAVELVRLPTLVAELAHAPEQTAVVAETFDAARDDDEPGRVHLEPHAFVPVAVEEVEGARVQRQESANARVESCRRAAAAELPQPANERRIRRRVKHEGTTAGDELANSLSHHPGRRQR